MTHDSILADAPDTELALRVEENLIALFRAMAGSLPGGEIVEGVTGGRHHTFPGNPMFKGAWRSRLAADEVDDAIDETLAWFRERKAPYMFWWTGSGTTPADLGARLSARGLLSMEEQQHHLAAGIVQAKDGAPCMVATLSRMNESVLEQVPPGYALEPVENESSLDDFRRVVIESYGIPEWAGQAWVDATARIGIGRTPWKMFVGRLHGTPVATNMLFCGGGVASVYAVATVPAARGKGIGGAVTLAPLLEARDAGYRHAVLFATEMGVHAYERIGFRMTDRRINRHLWRRET